LSLGLAQLVWLDWTEPSKQKKSGPGLGLKPNQPKLLLAKDVFGKTHPYVFLMYFILVLFWYLAKRAPFGYQKNPKIFGDLRWFIYGLLTCCFILFYFLCVLFFCVACSIYIPLQLNVNLLCNVFFPSCLKRVNKRR
jgi:hypothetical protein